MVISGGAEINMKPLSKTEFKTHALEVFREIEKSGQARIITDHGRPTLEIKKLRQQHPSPLAVLKGSVIKFDEPTTPVADDTWENA
jgi:antitoxin (DNA-binding transcriptional repressor) of toxin-antitoxin stability system